MREAFRMKIEEDASDEKISKWLRSQGVGRTYKKDGRSPSPISARVTNDLWKDPFYYGIWEYGDLAVDLREKNPYYMPMISKEEYDILIERYYGNQPHKGKKEVKEEHQDTMPLDERFIVTADGAFLSFNIPNKKRFYANLAELRKTNPTATLKDVVKSSQIRFACKNKQSAFYNFEKKFDEIEEAILRKLQTFAVDEKHYEEYRVFMEGQYKGKQAENLRKKRITQRNKNDTESQLHEYVRKNGSLKKDEIEKKVYENEKKRLSALIESMEKELAEFKKSERNDILEFESFFDMLNNADQYYKHASYVQKRFICRILFSNILLTHEKTLQIQPKP